MVLQLTARGGRLPKADGISPSVLLDNFGCLLRCVRCGHTMRYRFAGMSWSAAGQKLCLEIADAEDNDT